jgi:hypothetical protein
LGFGIDRKLVFAVQQSHAKLHDIDALHLLDSDEFSFFLLFPVHNGRASYMAYWHKVALEQD